MAEHEDAKGTGDRGANASVTPEQADADSAATSELPEVESPPLSPGAQTASGAKQISARELIAIAEPNAERTFIARARFRLKPRQKRHALLAASVALAAALGAVVGAIATDALVLAPHVNVARRQDRQPMQQSIAHLTRQVADLKASLASANQATRDQIARLAERFNRKSAEITGSIAGPAQHVLAPLPRPRPPSTAATRDRLTVLPNWWIRAARGGFVYVQGHGGIYQVVPGALLPGLGPVRAIRRWNGRWMVVTPKGVIVSLRDRGYFE